jgi:hypothetical protein
MYYVLIEMISHCCYYAVMTLFGVVEVGKYQRTYS